MVVATMERPAIAGGTPVRTAPLASIGDSSGRDVGDEELAQLDRGHPFRRTQPE